MPSIKIKSTTEQSFRVKVFFYKKAEVIFISHLDLMCVFERAIRRARLPVRYTHGFNPHIKLSFQRALSLGKASSNEVFIVRLSEKADLAEMRRVLNKQLPHGVGITKMVYV